MELHGTIIKNIFQNVKSYKIVFPIAICLAKKIFVLGFYENKKEHITLDLDLIKSQFEQLCLMVDLKVRKCPKKSD